MAFVRIAPAGAQAPQRQMRPLTIQSGDSMPTTWIIAANAGRARIFADAKSAKSLQEVEDMVNPAAQQRVSDIVTDRLSPRSAGNSGARRRGPAP